ncbi:MAG: sigma-54-dependent Fis family transcriptional regulator [Candidatus Hydrogenedentes bacterium]|nr:sigma-54-dependent Fis family transcriptional regulator [Candidatus Hydrogenedentota bacterium]
MPGRILVVDDEKLIRWSIRERLTRDGYEVLEAEDGASARRIIENNNLGLALLDLKLPDTNGMDLLRFLLEVSPDVPVIIITAYSSVESAVGAMKSGAYDYLTKPFNLDELSIVVQRTLETVSMRKRLSNEVREQKERFGLANVVGESPKMAEIKSLVRKIARSEASTVLLLGESGVGKDLIARAIHVESNRSERPFMNITCTALPDALLESELFGHERGAFTDAHAQKKGLFELAQGGTVFMDEIGDMSAALQAKLLRALEDKAFKRIGGTADITVNVRVIAATNRSIDSAIEDKSFREDLYYRLSTLPIFIPPLRERAEDLPRLIEHFFVLYNNEFHRGLKSVAAPAMEKLLHYDWPGNVRELRNVLERAVLLSTGSVLTDDDILLGRAHLGSAPHVEKFRVRLPENGCKLSEVEAQLVQQALQRSKWNQTRAAALLGISRDQIRYKMEKFSLGHSA